MLTAVPAYGCKSAGSTGGPTWTLTAVRVAYRHFASPSCPTALFECTSIHMQQDNASLTIDDHSRRGAFPFGHNVFGNTSIIGGVRKPGLLDDQVVIDGDVKISVFHGIDHLFVLQPLHLGVSKGQRRGGESAPGHTTTGTASVITLLSPKSASSQGTPQRTHLTHAAN